MIGLSTKYYLKKVIGNVVVVGALSTIIPLIAYTNMENGVVRLFTVCSVSVLSTILVLYYIGLTKKEKGFILDKIQAFITKDNIKIKFL